MELFDIQWFLLASQLVQNHSENLIITTAITICDCIIINLSVNSLEKPRTHINDFKFMLFLL